MLAALGEVFSKYLGNKSICSREQIQAMADARQFKEIVETFKNKRVYIRGSVSSLVGYAYYQLTEYEAAIPHLQKALKVAPADYYSSLFLAVCLKALNRNREALAQYLKCLEQHETHAGEILEGLLPLAAEIEDPKEREQTFNKTTASLAKLGTPNPYLAPVLFFQRRDSDLTPSVLQTNRFCYIYSAKELADSGHGKFLGLGVPEKLRFVRLEDNRDIWVDTCAPYVAEISDAKIMSGSSLVLVGDNKILSDVLADKEFGHFANMKYDPMVSAHRNDALLIKSFDAKTEIPEGILLCGLASNAYGHWFAEFLPKLRFFERHPRFLQIPIIIDEGMPQSHYDFLSALVSNAIYRLPKGSSLRIKNLFVAPADTFFPLELVPFHTVPPERQSSLTVGALRYLRERVGKHLAPAETAGSRIFLSRRNCQWRRLIEEETIIAELQKLNFEVVYIEDFSFEEQVRIFQKAEFIVAPNGSALNNLIFSRPEVKALLLGQQNLFNWGGWFGSFFELGYSPQYLAGISLGDKNQKHTDYSIPAAVVRDKVIEMLG